MATPKKNAPAAKAKPVGGGTTATQSAEAQAPADTPNTPEGIAPATAAAPQPHDAAGVGGLIAEAPNGIGEGVQVDGQGLPPVLTGKTHLRVAARVDGFRRCGRAWPASGDTVAKSAFTADQVARLLTDPDLVVTEVDAE
jgi:hypothetical protein